MDITFFKFKGNCHKGEMQYDTGIFSSCLTYDDSRTNKHWDSENHIWLNDSLEYWYTKGFLTISENIFTQRAYDNRLGNYEDFSYEDWCWYWNQCKRVVEKLKTIGEDIEEFEWKGHWNRESIEDLFKMEVEKLAKEYGVNYKLEFKE